jgi:type IV secretion system protein VirB6
MAMCPQPDDAGMVAGVLDTVDCHIRVLVHDSYRELVGPNTWFAAAFTAMLTIYVALIGYQLMTGRGGLRVVDLPMSALKIGLIFAFLTSWAAYQTLVFDFLFDGPAEIVATLVSPLSASGFDGNVLGGVQRAFEDMTGAAGVYGAMASPTANLLQGGPMLASGMLWLAAMLLVLITLGLVIAGKIVLAFLLAIGPIFIGMFLFDATRGLFHGWLRATVTFALAPLAVHVLGAAMLLMLAPFLDVLIDNASQQEFDMGPIMTISLIVIVFAVVMVLGLRAVALIGQGLNGGRQRWQDLLPDRQTPADAPRENAQPGRAEQLVALASAPDTRVATAGAIHASHATVTRRTGEISDALAVSAAHAGPRLGQVYQRAPRPATRDRN